MSTDHVPGIHFTLPRLGPHWTLAASVVTPLWHWWWWRGIYDALDLDSWAVPSSIVPNVDPAGFVRDVSLVKGGSWQA
jgi:hypothetical protein